VSVAGQVRPINEEKMNAFLVKVVGDFGATLSSSLAYCTADSLALNGPALGAVATEEPLRNTVLAGGFKQFRRATETPFNRIFEARN
jgi:hypothetical protein